MCFIIDAQNPYAMIAKEDIRCFKSLTERVDEEGNTRYYATVHSFFEYEIGKEYPEVTLTPILRSQNTDSDRIEEGYHSNWKVGRYEFLIPKGSTYYMDSKYKEYVSSRIKFIGPKIY